MSEESRKRALALIALSGMLTMPSDPPPDVFIDGELRRSKAKCRHCGGKLRKASRYKQGKSFKVMRCGACGKESK